MTDLDDYLGRVQATVWSAAGWISEEGLGRVQHLVDHGEPAEAMCSLAWIIVNEDTLVPMALIGDIRRYSAELIPAQHMPPTLDSHRMDDEIEGGGAGGIGGAGP